MPCINCMCSRNDNIYYAGYLRSVEIPQSCPNIRDIYILSKWCHYWKEYKMESEHTDIYTTIICTNPVWLMQEYISLQEEINQRDALIMKLESELGRALERPA